MDMNDDQIVEGLLNQNKRAIDYFVKCYSPYIYTICYNILKTKPEAEEACQDSCLKILNKISDFNRGSVLKSWIFTIAYRTGLDYKRRQKTYSNEETLNYQASETHSDEILLQTERRNKILLLLKHLSEEDAELVTMFYLNDMSVKEIVTIKGQSESNIKIKLFRARKRIGSTY